MSETLPSPNKPAAKKARSRALRVAFVVALILGLAWLAWYPGKFVLHVILVIRDHEKRLAKITDARQQYTQKDWQQVFEDCLKLYRQHHGESVSFAKSDYPESIRSLSPHEFCLSDNAFEMRWTGGFDDFSVNVTILMKTGTQTGADDDRPPGIFLYDGRVEDAEMRPNIYVPDKSILDALLKNDLPGDAIHPEKTAEQAVPPNGP